MTVGQYIAVSEQLRLTIPEIHVGTAVSTCRDVNTRLLADASGDGGYAEDIFENLVFRYEEPNGMTRWDSPLFTVLYDDATPPLDEIWEALIGSDGKVKTAKPNQATVLVRAVLLCPESSVGADTQSGEHRNQPRTLTTSTNWTASRRRFSRISCRIRGTTLAKAAARSACQPRPSTSRPRQCHCPNCNAYADSLSI